MNENPAYKSGFATLIGRPNVGKSTLMNRLIGQKIAITSNKPQTTRNRIQTVLTLDEGQIVFLDTPGIHKAKNKLGDYMVNVAEHTLNDVDVIEKDEDRLFYRSGCAGEVVCGLSDCAGYSGVQRTYKTEINLCGRAGSFYRGGWKNSYELQSDHYSHRADQFHRTESAEHSHAYGTGQKDPQGICPQGGI